MAARALDFAQAHPATDASYTSLVAQLQDAVSRGEALAALQSDGRIGERAAVAQRETLRRTMERIQLRHLVGVAERAVKDHPELVGLFVHPAPGGPNRVFITAAKAMVAAATPHRDLFVSLGLGDTFLDELTQALAQFDGATEAAHAGRRDHVGARAELVAVADECVQMLALLDGFYLIRFRNDAQSLAAWESSNNLVGPFRPGQPAPEPAPAPVSPPAATPVDPVVNPTAATDRNVA